MAASTAAAQNIKHGYHGGMTIVDVYYLIKAAAAHAHGSSVKINNGI